MQMHTIPQSADPSFVSCGKFVSKEGGFVHPRRNLDTYVLLFGSTGEYPIAEEREEFLLSPSAWLLLTPGRTHYGTGPCTEGLSHYWCHFTISEADAESGTISLPAFGRSASPERVRLLFHQLIDASRRDSPYKTQICDKTLSLILFELAESGSPRPQSFVPLAEKVVEWIRLYATEIRSVSEVAAHFGYNEEYLTTAMKRATGKSIVAHLREARVNEAKNLLLCSDFSVKEIAFRCGFSDEKYFLRVFRTFTELSPGEYRKTYARMHYNRK